MNSKTRKKLGLPQKDFADIQNSEKKLELYAPVSLEASTKEALGYSSLYVKNINVGSLRKQDQHLVVENKNDGSFIEIINPNNKKYFYTKAVINNNYQGELLKYNTSLALDQNNPFDPIFVSFSRLVNKNKFLQTNNNFGGQNILEISSSNVSGLNGSYINEGSGNGRLFYKQVFGSNIILWNAYSGWQARKININTNNLEEFLGNFNSNNSVIDSTFWVQGFFNSSKLGTWDGIDPSTWQSYSSSYTRNGTLLPFPSVGSFGGETEYRGYTCQQTAEVPNPNALPNGCFDNVYYTIGKYHNITIKTGIKFALIGQLFGNTGVELPSNLILYSDKPTGYRTYTADRSNTILPNSSLYANFNILKLNNTTGSSKWVVSGNGAYWNNIGVTSLTSGLNPWDVSWPSGLSIGVNSSTGSKTWSLRYTNDNIQDGGDYRNNYITIDTANTGSNVLLAFKNAGAFDISLGRPDFQLITGFSGINNNNLPSGSWSSGANKYASGLFLDSKGFFKPSKTRVSQNKAFIYGVPTSTTGVNLGTGLTVPSSGFIATYPHSYNAQNFPAFNHNLIVVPTYINESTGISNISGINDIIIISTGISQKKIIYITPHTLSSFWGFWSKIETGRRPSLVNSKVSVLTSGKLMAPSSENYIFTGLNSKNISGEIFNSQTYYNVGQCRLQQTTPIKDTLFYKIYEPIYKRNAFNTGTWDGIIPKGTPFQVETIRTKNFNIGNPNLTLKFYSENYFITNSTFTGDGGDYVYTINNPNQNGLFANFRSQSVTYNSDSASASTYIAEKDASKKNKAKLMGALWERGFTLTNRKVNRMLNLFEVSPKIYSYGTYESGELKFVYAAGVLTSAGVRSFSDKSITPHPNNNKFLPTGDTIKLFS